MPDDFVALREPPFAEAASSLVELLSGGSRVFLLGAGCSTCAGHPLTSELTDIVLNKGQVSGDTQTILTALRERFVGSAGATIEDFMSELVDLIAIGQRRRGRSATSSKLPLGARDFEAHELTKALQEIKEAIVKLFTTLPSRPDTHWDFVRAVHRTLRVGKSAGSRPVDYIVLNYDTLLEDALGLERIPYADGFRGGEFGWWDLDVFGDPAMQARVLKVHGSIDWCASRIDVSPRRIRRRPLPDCLGPSDDILISPAATKYKEAQRDPYAQVFGVMRTALRPAVGTEVVLAICGYGFGDDHINAELDRALREAEGRLTVVVMTGLEGPPTVAQAWLEDVTVRDQVRVFARRGVFHGSTAGASGLDLPWWKFESLTRILGGEQ